MTTLALVLGAVLAIVVVVVVARPFLREPSTTDDRLDSLGAEERRRLQLAEERDQALAALKELEFDHRTGKVSDEDYHRAVGPLRRRVGDALRALEPPGEKTMGASAPEPGSPRDESPPQPATAPTPGPAPSEQGRPSR